MDIAQTIDDYLDTTQAIILSFLVKLGPFFVALMPALFTGYAVYHIFKPDAGEFVALFFALVVSVAVETVGIVSVHTTIDLYNGMEAGHIKPVKFWVMFLMVPFYVIVIIFTIGFAGDTFPKLVQALGLGAPILTVIVYTAVVLNQDSERIKREIDSTRQAEQVVEQGGARHKQAVELEELRLSYALREVQTVERARVKIEAGTIAPEPALVLAEPARASTQTCPECNQEGISNTIQGMNAHKRFCKIRTGNGRDK